MSEENLNKEDLGIKIVPKEEAFWIGVKENKEKEIEDAKHCIEIDEDIIKLCEEKLNLLKQQKQTEMTTPSYP